MVEILASDLMLVQQVGQQLLPSRIPQIKDGQLRGMHWYLAIMEEASEIVQESRVQKDAA